jgi:hypothetical protein
MDEIRLAKGFIMQKMRSWRLVSGPHTSPDNLPKGCPKELRPYVNTAIEELKREQLLSVHSTGYGPQATAVLSKEMYDYANLYCRHYGLPEEEFGKPQKRRKAEPLPEDVLRALRFTKKK